MSGVSINPGSFVTLIANGQLRCGASRSKTSAGSFAALSPRRSKGWSFLHCLVGKPFMFLFQAPRIPRVGVPGSKGTFPDFRFEATKLRVMFQAICREPCYFRTAHGPPKSCRTPAPPGGAGLPTKCPLGLLCTGKANLKHVLSCQWRLAP